MSYPPATAGRSSSRISPSNRVIHSSKNGHRQIGYAIYRPEQVQPPTTTTATTTTTAILWFYPLGGCSISVDHAAPSFRHYNYQTCVISVDRPGVGDTDILPTKKESTTYINSSVSSSNSSFPVDRIQSHADDVMEVLDHEGITDVYILAICLGHPYALEVARRLLLASGNSSSNNNNKKKNNQSTQLLKGISLVSPFVSTACPESWRVARLGNSVPSTILSWATKGMALAETMALSLCLSKSALEKLVSREERDHFGWNESDLEDMLESIPYINQLAAPAKSIEAQLGANALWQPICDDFAVESGLGLNVGDDDNNNETAQTHEKIKNDSHTSSPNFPIEIHACREDKIAPAASVEWLAHRCFGGTDVITWHPEAHSHEIMTFLGGPMRSPYMLHEIARGWKLLDDGEATHNK